MSKQVDCQFCGFNIATVTAIRTTPKGKKTKLQLCDRRQYLHQMLIQVKPLEDSISDPPCVLCGKLSQFTAERHSKEGDFLGRYRVCDGCVRRQELSVADRMRVANSWAPGLLELPSLGEI